MFSFKMRDSNFDIEYGWLSLLDDKSPTSVNLGNDHGFIIKECSLGRRPFEEAQNKVMRTYA